MGWCIPVGRVLAALEGWLTGYRSEHFKFGLQMAVALALGLLPILVSNLYKHLEKGGSTIFTAITVAVVLEPSTGDVFRKIIMRLLAVGVSGGIALLVLYLAIGDDQYNPKYDKQGYQDVLSKWVVPATAILGFIFAVNKQRYYWQQAFWFTALYALPIVMLPAIRSKPENYYTGAAYRMLNLVDGIIIAAIVSFVVLPVRARGLLQKKMASTLIKIGDLAVWLVGQVCVLPQPGTADWIPGTTGTDTTWTYTDDGLHAKLAPLMQTASELTADLAYMGKLLETAAAEYYIVGWKGHPRRFPVAQYKMLLESCHVTLGICLSLIYALEGNMIHLQVCQRHIGDLSEMGVRLSAAFTALSSLIRTPKKKKNWAKWLGQGCGKKGKGKHKQSHGGGAAHADGAAEAADAAPEVAAVAEAIAELEQERRRRQLEKLASAAAADGKGGAALAPPAGMDAAADTLEGTVSGVTAVTTDDPFAGLAGGATESSRRAVVSLTDSELHSAQVLARHLSAVIQRRSYTSRSSGALRYDEAADERRPLTPVGEASLELPPGYSRSESDGVGLAGGGGGGEPDADAPAAQGPDPQPQPSAPGSNGGAGGGPCLQPRPSIGVGGLAGAAPGEERREWVLHKLRLLVDSMKSLEDVAYRERQASSYQPGLPAFMLVVHSCVNLTRQCGACLTALDPPRGALLHAHYRACDSRTEGKLEHMYSV